MSKELLTNSRMAAFKTCRRLHYFTYELGLRRIDEAKALRMGSAFHAGIEALTKPQPWVDDSNAHAAMAEVLDESTPLSRACDAVRKYYRWLPEGFDEYRWAIERETILRMVCGYEWRWRNADLEYVSVESSFEIPLVNPATGAESKLFNLAGKIDGIVRLEDGRLAVKETKTMSEDLGPDAPVWRRLRMDSQISLYIHAARMLGHQVDTVLYDCARKPSIEATAVPLCDSDGIKIVLDRDGNRVRTKDGKKWRQTADTELGYVLQTRPMTVAEWGEKLAADIYERPDFYFTRKEIPRLDHDIEEHQTEIWEIQQTVRDAQRTGKHYRTVTRNTCPYCAHFDHCSNGTDVSIAAPIGFEFVDDIHPELERKTYVLRTSLPTVGSSPANAPAASSSPAGQTVG